VVVSTQHSLIAVLLRTLVAKLSACPHFVVSHPVTGAPPDAVVPEFPPEPPSPPEPPDPPEPAPPLPLPELLQAAATTPKTTDP
jgi:hypothetical protein